MQDIEYFVTWKGVTNEYTFVVGSIYSSITRCENHALESLIITQAFTILKTYNWMTFQINQIMWKMVNFSCILEGLWIREWPGRCSCNHHHRHYAFTRGTDNFIRRLTAIFVNAQYRYHTSDLCNISSL